MRCNVQCMYVVQVSDELMKATLPAFGPFQPESRCACGMHDATHTCPLMSLGCCRYFLSAFKRTVLGFVLCEDCCSGQIYQRGAGDGQDSKYVQHTWSLLL